MKKYAAIVAGAAMALAAYLAPASAAPTPSISLTPLVGALSFPGACAKPASVDMAFWEMPNIAQEQGIGGLTRVKIDLTAAGNLSHEALYTSSGNPWLDDAALLSARMSHYSAEVAACSRVGGSYLYNVEF